MNPVIGNKIKWNYNGDAVSKTYYGRVVVTTEQSVVIQWSKLITADGISRTLNARNEILTSRPNLKIIPEQEYFKIMLS